jgi:hypothetical protein
MTMTNRLIVFVCLLLGLHAVAQAQDNSALAKQLANPVASLISVPFLFLRIPVALCDIASQGLTGTLELYTAFDVPAIQVGSQTVPLETDVTTPLAHLLERPAVWDYEIGSFLKGDQWSDRAGLWMLQRYRLRRLLSPLMQDHQLRLKVENKIPTGEVRRILLAQLDDDGAR